MNTAMFYFLIVAVLANFGLAHPIDYVDPSVLNILDGNDTLTSASTPATTPAYFALLLNGEPFLPDADNTTEVTISLASAGQPSTPDNELAVDFDGNALDKVEQAGFDETIDRRNDADAHYRMISFLNLQSTYEVSLPPASTFTCSLACPPYENAPISMVLCEAWKRKMDQDFENNCDFPDMIFVFREPRKASTSLVNRDGVFQFLTRNMIKPVNLENFLFESPEEHKRDKEILQAEEERRKEHDQGEVAFNAFRGYVKRPNPQLERRLEEIRNNSRFAD